MKIVYWVLGALGGIAILLIVVPLAASELGGEVVTLERAETDGEPSRIRIWIVDRNGDSWIEHGDAGSYWMNHLQTSAQLVLVRDGESRVYEATTDADAHDLYHDLRRQKYGWADQLIALLGGGIENCDGVPVRLRLANNAANGAS